MVAKRPPAASKAERVELAKNASVDDVVSVVFAAGLNHWTANEAAALNGLDPEGVHEMRVALRRMRAALSDFQGIIPAVQIFLAQARNQVAHIKSRYGPRLGRLSR